jgi:hypothetical protein
MKKYVLMNLIVFFTSNLFAQNEKTLGDWKLNYETEIDTTYNGIEEINSNPEAYKQGSKKLSSEYLALKEIYPDEYGNYTFDVAITKDLDVFWFAVSYKRGFVKKIAYNPKTNKYLITKGDFTKRNLVIEHDEKNQKLLFIDEELGITRFEFSRK